MKKQCVIRTFPNGWNKTTDYLTEKLNDGWIVVFITPVSEGIVEYILEKEYKSQ
jgi:hypothetical protein